MEARISIITLGVDELPDSTAFYRNGLGLPYLEGRSNAEISFFELNKGSLWLALYPRTLLAADANVADTAKGFPGFTLAHNVRSRADVHEIFLSAVGAGAKAMKEPQEASWGGYHAYIADLDGFLWEIAFNPFSWIE